MLAGPHPRSLALGGGLPAAALRRLARVADALPPREAYALWAESYPPLPHNPLMQAEQAVVAPIIEAAMPIRALDVGTGTGRYLSLLESAGARVVVGVDMSLAMLGRTAGTAARVCADARRLPFRDASFDLVCSSLMVGDLPDLREWVREATRLLAPGGHLIYSDFHPSWTTERWRRTFRTADGRLRELSYFPHAIDEHLSLLQQASLHVRTIREPRMNGRAVPVVVVFHAVKPGLSMTARRRSEASPQTAETDRSGFASLHRLFSQPRYAGSRNLQGFPDARSLPQPQQVSALEISRTAAPRQWGPASAGPPAARSTLPGPR